MTARIDGIDHLEQDVRALDRSLRPGLLRYIAESDPVTVMTAPVIYSLIVPVALLDLWMSAYQAICFRVYRIPLVVRADHVVLDRHRLPYLNAIEKVNCVYCGYVNGVFAYVREIASRTEQYWCPIQHARPVAAPHPRYARFVPYGDAPGYRRRQMPLRREVQARRPRRRR